MLKEKDISRVFIRGDVFFNRAAAYTQMGDYEKCIKDCEMAISIDPNYSKAYNRLG